MTVYKDLFILSPTGCDPNDPLVEHLICRETEAGGHVVLETAFGFSEAAYRLRRIANPLLPERSADSVNPVAMLECEHR